MVGRAAPANQSQKKRMALIKTLGCVPCVLKNWPDVAGDCHHVVDGGVRLGHDHTFSCCLWHHRGEVSEGYTKQQMGGMIGSSLAHGSRFFAEEFGSQATLVAVQNYILERFEASPWLEFSMPRGIILDIYYFWTDLRKSDGTL